MPASMLASSMASAESPSPSSAIPSTRHAVCRRPTKNPADRPTMIDARPRRPSNAATLVATSRLPASSSITSTKPLHPGPVWKSKPTPCSLSTCPRGGASTAAGSRTMAIAAPCASAGRTVEACFRSWSDPGATMRRSAAAMVWSCRYGSASLSQGIPPARQSDAMSAPRSFEPKMAMRFMAACWLGRVVSLPVCGSVILIPMRRGLGAPRGGQAARWRRAAIIPAPHQRAPREGWPARGDATCPVGFHGKQRGCNVRSRFSRRRGEGGS
jgi:hypothetical protein